jgi:hypothetical protein
MSDQTDKLLNLVKKQEKAVAPSANVSMPKEVLHALVGLLAKLQSLLMVMDIQTEMEALEGLMPVTSNEQPKAQSMTAILDELEKNTTVRKGQDGKREYLLHRPTENFEYEKSVKDQKTYQTRDKTVWGVEFVKATDQREGANPVVSLWIPENKIESIPNAHDNVGTWGDLGANPQKGMYQVVVSPGIYEIYCELKA